MSDTLNPAAAHHHHMPVFITAPGQTDWLMVGAGLFLLLIVVLIGVFYFKLHALPEQVTHRANKIQLEIVGVLALLALFTHNHLYWIAALLLAMITIPDFSTPLNSIAESLGKLAGRDEKDSEAAPSGPPAEPKPAAPPSAVLQPAAAAAAPASDAAVVAFEAEEGKA
jgi:hypothetical protein